MYPYPEDAAPLTPIQQQQQMLFNQSQAAMPPLNDQGTSGFLNSPGGAMAMAALGNLGAMSSGRQPSLNPIQQYQSAVAQNANQRLLREKALREQDPYWEFEEGKRRGYIPQEMDFFAYRDRARTGSFRPTSYAPIVGTDAEGKPALMTTVYDPESGTWSQQQLSMGGFTPAPKLESVDTGGGTLLINPLENSSQFVPRSLRPGEEPAVRGAQAAATAGAESDAKQYDSAIATTWANRDAYALAKGFYDTSERALKALQEGRVETGMIDAFMLKTFGVGSEELGRMNADEVQAVLENLQITNLAPVTVQELKTVAGLWADIGRQKEPNVGVLMRAMERTERLMSRIQADTVTQASRVRRYGGEEEYRDLISVNPFIRESQKAIDSVNFPEPDPNDPEVEM